MNFLKLMVITFFFYLPTLVKANCPKTISTLTTTENFIAYLGNLLEENIIGEKELLKLKKSLSGNRKKLSNPITENESLESTALLIHREEIEKYLSDPSLDKSQLLNWCLLKTEEKNQIKGAREKTKEVTKEVFQRMEFKKVTPKPFRMGTKIKEEIRFTHNFEVMTTLVTQKLWAEIMGENPSTFADGPWSTELLLNNKRIKMQPDNPVETVTWWSAAEYANRLSIKAGLKPVYDFRWVKFDKSTRPENGTLKAKTLNLKEGEGWAYDVEINAPAGDIYQSEGYRLLTLEEYTYLFLEGSTGKGNFFENGEALLKEHAWYASNSKETTHPVAELKPFVIGGASFYDLIGNVMEWTDSWVTGELKTKGNINNSYNGLPDVDKTTIGGSWESRSMYILPEPTNLSREQSGSHTGFRLIRSIK